MTIELLNPDDTGEIPRPAVETRTRIDVGEATQNLAGWQADLPPYRRPDVTGELPALRYMPLGLSGGNLEGPQKPPPPLPKPPKYATGGTVSAPIGITLSECDYPLSRTDMADAQPVAPWERVAETSLLGSLTADVDGSLRPAVPPKPAPPKPKPKYVGRHRRTLRSRLATVFARLWGAL